MIIKVNAYKLVFNTDICETERELQECYINTDKIQVIYPDKNSYRIHFDNNEMLEIDNIDWIKNV